MERLIALSFMTWTCFLRMTAPCTIALPPPDTWPHTLANFATGTLLSVVIRLIVSLMVCLTVCLETPNKCMFINGVFYVRHTVN